MVVGTIGFLTFMIGLLTLCAGETGGLFLLGFGFTFSAATPLVLGLAEAPERFFFDNATGQLRITEPRGGVGELPYSEILGFVVHRGEDRQGWSVDMLRFHGTTWSLFTSRKEQACTNVQRWLEERVTLGMECSEPKHVSTPHIEEETTPHRTRIRWRHRRRTKRSVLFFFIAFGMLITIGGATDDWAVASLILVGAAFLSSLLFVAAERSARGWEVVEVGDGVLVGRTEGGTPRFTMPLSTVETVGFFLVPGREQPWLSVLDAEDAQHLRRFEAGQQMSPADLFTLTRISLSKRRLPCTGWSVTEKLVLETKVRAALDRHRS